jgi:hypothetical protein
MIYLIIKFMISDALLDPIPRLPHHIAGDFDEHRWPRYPRTVTLVIPSVDTLAEYTETVNSTLVDLDTNRFFRTHVNAPIRVLDTGDYAEDPVCWTCDVRRAGSCVPEDIRCLDEEAMRKLHLIPGQITSIRELLNKFS